MNDRAARNKRAVVDAHVTRQQYAIDDDHIVADHAVVPDVRRGHQVALVANDRRALRLRAAMHGAILAKDIAVADLQIAAAPAVELQVLRLMTEDRAHVNLILAPDLRVSGEIGVRQNPRPRANLHMFLDDHMRPDLDRRVQFRLRADNCCWVNRHDVNVPNPSP